MMAVLNSAVELVINCKGKTAIKWQNYINIVGQRWWVDASCCEVPPTLSIGEKISRYALERHWSPPIEPLPIQSLLRLYKKKEYIWELLMQSQIKLKKEILDKDILKWTHDVHKK